MYGSILISNKVLAADFVFSAILSVQTTQIYTESPQATVDKHIREWNEMNFPRSIYIDEKDLEERNVPDFLKSR